MQQKDNAVKSLTGGVAYLFKANKVYEKFFSKLDLSALLCQVTGIRGHGSVSGPGQVTVKREDGSSETLKAKNILLAVGSEVTPFPGITVRRFTCTI